MAGKEVIAALAKAFSHVPVLGLTDPNPYGLNLLVTVKHGSRHAPHRADNGLTPRIVPLLRWTDLSR